MRRVHISLQKAEFEARIFVSFGIVASVCILSATVFAGKPSLFVLCGQLLGITSATAMTFGYLSEVAVMILASLLRMWAGSVLTPHRVMAFRVQVDALKTTGPYRLVRNPIYLADFIALCGFSLCLPLAGLLMPVLFYVHYVRLIMYEEGSLRQEFGERFEEYERGAPRLIPDLPSFKILGSALREFTITGEGIRHNALYALFIPGFIVAAMSQEFWYAAVIGLPGVIDWAVIHTKIGVRK